MKISEKKQSTTTVEETSKSNSGNIETITEKIENTPLLKRWEEGKGWSFGIGNYRLSEYFENEEDMLRLLEDKDYNTITGLISAMIDATLKMYNLIK